MEITLNLNKTQIDFLKEFAANHYPGAKDNELTDRPLHLVQTKSYEYVRGSDQGEYDVFIDENGDFEPIRDPEDVVVIHGKYEDETDIVDYETAYKNGINGRIICDVSDYFAYYDVPDSIAVYSAKETYKTVACFFIRKQARNYMYSQAHNLNKPRIFSVHRGYANDNRYEYEHFYDLLLMIGNQLNDKVIKNDDFKYKLLTRLAEKCDCYLKEKPKDASILWAGNVRTHIEKMKELYNSLAVKPKWMTMNTIDDYAAKMNANPLICDLADDIEQYFCDRCEYNSLSSDRIRWLNDENNNVRSRTDVVSAVYSTIVRDIDSLIEYFNDELSELLDENDELITTAKNLRERLLIRKSERRKG